MGEQHVAAPAGQFLAPRPDAGAQDGVAQGDPGMLRQGVAQVQRREGRAQRNQRVPQRRQPRPAVARRPRRRVRRAAGGDNDAGRRRASFPAICTPAIAPVLGDQSRHRRAVLNAYPRLLDIPRQQRDHILGVGRFHREDAPVGPRVRRHAARVQDVQKVGVGEPVKRRLEKARLVGPKLRPHLLHRPRMGEVTLAPAGDQNLQPQPVILFQQRDGRPPLRRPPRRDDPRRPAPDDDDFRLHHVPKDTCRDEPQ